MASTQQKQLLTTTQCIAHLRRLYAENIARPATKYLEVTWASSSSSSSIWPKIIYIEFDLVTSKEQSVIIDTDMLITSHEARNIRRRRNLQTRQKTEDNENEKEEEEEETEKKKDSVEAL